MIKALLIFLAVAAALMVSGHVYASFFGPDTDEMAKNDRPLAEADRLLRKPMD